MIILASGSATRRVLLEQAGVPFVVDTAPVDEAAVKAVNDLLRDWLIPGPSEKDESDWRQGLLNTAASKINQTI